MTVLIVLSGPSSSGKTSLARAVQKLATRPFLHVEADRFWPAMPLGQDLEHDSDYQARVILSVHEAIVALCNRDLEVIADGSLPNDRTLRDQCLAILRSGADTRLVAVTSSVDALRRRERTRPDREHGWAERQLTFIFEDVEFDAVIDTSLQTPEQCAKELLEALGLR